MKFSNFEWDEFKNELNKLKYGVSFYEAAQAFLDPNRVIAEDEDHSRDEIRYYCFGKVNESIMTVRFTYRGSRVRIIGAGFWRKGEDL